MDYTIHENTLKTDRFIELWESAGWGSLDRELVETSLKNSYVTFEVRDGEKTIAMARLIGDGAMAFFLKDLVVLPEYQGKGVGRRLLTHIEEYIRSQLKEGWWSYLQLMSAKDKEEFYLKCGYKAHPHERSGAGFTKVLIGGKNA
ncbi:MAG: GNAT family N-acetyltransferase [Ruminococcus sp.]|uniref:GNAT family N-acetyltransferase n=1 Tax=Ruminococcus sp. TaxID=41978 RepID=UPI0025F5B4E3|nr:GNAT family N-acetyltransferase [Ruminococcus sp.]MCR5600868.1 GNAT family N-acetyltransferase [Ruminococcus sp.]